MNWRPEGWETTIEVSWSKASQVGEQFPVGFEGGADAMVEAICERIEKVAVENPYSMGTTEGLVWWKSCEKILTLLRKKSSN